jgi:hypothetical protein
MVLNAEFFRLHVKGRLGNVKIECSLRVRA